MSSSEFTKLVKSEDFLFINSKMIRLTFYKTNKSVIFYQAMYEHSF